MEKSDSRQQRVRLTFVFALLCNLFFFRQIGPGGFVLLTFLEYLFLRFTLASFETRDTSFSLTAIGFLHILFGALMIRTDNGFVTGILFLSISFLLLLTGSLLTLGTTIFSSMGIFLVSLLQGSFGWIINAFVSLGNSFGLRQEKLIPNSSSAGWLRKLVPYIIGFFVGLPLLAVVLLLMLQADPVFAKFIEQIKIWESVSSVVKRSLLTVIVFVAASPIIFLKKSKPNISLVTFFTTKRFEKLLVVPMILLAVLLGTFLVIQWPYVFAKVSFETDLSKFGVATYSEYVKKGFIELLLLSVVMYATLWIVRIGMRLDTKSLAQKILTVVSTLLYGEVAIFLLSIARRVWLYQMYHGWTLIRLYGIWLLAGISILFTTLFLRRFVKIQWVKIELFLAAVMVGFLGIWNAEQFLVTTHPPTVNKRPDPIYLVRLSADGYTGWKSAFAFAKDTIQKTNSASPLSKDQIRDAAYAGWIIKTLASNYQTYVFSYGSKAEQRAYLLALFDSMIASQKEYRTRISNLQATCTHTASGQIISCQPQNNASSELTKLDETMRETIFVRGQIERKEISLEEIQTHIIDNWQTQPTTGCYFVCSNENSPYYKESGFIYNFYTFTKAPLHPPYKTPTLLDRMYTFSVSQHDAYSHMKQDMPYTELFTLEDSYMNLHKAIRALPADKREFTSDISFSMPFVQ